MGGGAPSGPDVSRPAGLEEAVTLLQELGDDGAVLGGGTWIMRAPLRGASLKPAYVALAGVAEAGGCTLGERTRLGATLTHVQIARLEEGAGALGAVAEAARRSAFPAVRNVATLAGNLAARPFPEADLVPALLAGAAEVELAGPGGRNTLPLERYLERADARPPGEIVTGVSLPAPAGRRSWFERATVRRAAEYSLASLALSVDVDGDGVVVEARVAVGAVEPAARRVRAAEDALSGAPLRALSVAEAGRALAEAVRPRDGFAAPGWYRRAILPHLLERAVARVAA